MNNEMIDQQIENNQYRILESFDGIFRIQVKFTRSNIWHYNYYPVFDDLEKAKEYVKSRKGANTKMVHNT